jgi:hypothetical protein
MENAFRHSFGGIRVHPDSPKVTGNEQAITEGRDIHFARARYQPGTARGDWLIGHELAHVVQQSGRSLGPQAFRPDLVPGRAPDETLAREIEADRAATDAVAGRPVRIALAATPGRPQAFAGETADPAALELEPEAAVPTTSPAQSAKSESKPDEKSEKDSNEKSDEASKEESSAESDELAEADSGELETSEPVSEDERGVDAGAKAAPPVLASTPTAPGQTGGGGGGGGGKAGGGGNIELLMPEAPSELSPAAKARLANVTAQVNAAAKATTALPTAQKTTEDARKAVTEPREQQKARGEASAVQQVDERPAPSASVEAACTRIREIIKAKRPPDEKSLVEAKPKEMAKQSGGQVQSDVQSRAGSVSGGYDAMDNPPKGGAGQKPVPAVNPPAQTATPAIDAHTAAPDPLAKENVSLDADAAKQKQSMDRAGMNSEPAKLVKSGPIADARTAAGELDAAAKSRPAEVLAQQAAAIDSAKSDMRALRDKASAALSTSRAGAVNQLVSTRVDTTASEEKQRAQAGRAMQAIFARAQSQVDGLLAPISQMAIKRWDAGVQQLSTRFEAVLADTKQKVEARYNKSGNALERFGGELTRLKDTWIGLPGWAVEAYDRAEREFADGCCDLARDISRDVNDIVVKCEKIVERARADIDKYVKSLPRTLRDWAGGQAQKLSLQLDDLQKRIVATQDGLNQDLVNRTNQAVQEVRERIHTLREEAKGFVGRIQDAIAQFLDDPARFIIDGLLELLGIAPARFWSLIDKIGKVADGIAKDPMGFANNLMKGVKDGFNQFFDRFPEHLLQGILDWLFSKLGEAGVQMPKDFSLPSIITLFLQVLGITWERIRKLIAKHIGEDNVALIEQAYSMVAELMAKGPEGIFALMEEQLAQMFNPQMIIDTVIAAVKDYLMGALIKQVMPKILLMLNPIGAILKAIEAIYRVIDWVFTHAERLFSLVEAVVNGAADILAGNTAGMAKAVEGGLARLIGPVIGFLADFIGLSGIPEAVKNAVLGLQQRVESVLDKVIGWLAEKAKGLLRGKDASGKGEDEVKHTEMGKAAAGELEKKPAGAMSHEELRAHKEAQARKLETKYNQQLEKSVKMAIRFQPAEEDKADGDIDFHIHIGPNDFDMDGAVEGGAESTGPKVSTYGELKKKQHKGKEAHHVPPKGLLGWMQAQASQTSQRMSEGEHEAYPWVSKLEGLDENVWEPGNPLAAINVDEHTHIKKNGTPSDAYRIHWGQETARKVLERLDGKGLRLIYRMKYEQLSPEDKKRYLELVHEAGGRADAANEEERKAFEEKGGSSALSTQFFRTELDHALELEQKERGEEIQQFAASMGNVAHGAYRQSHEAVVVALEQSDRDGTKQERSEAIRELKVESKSTWEKHLPDELKGKIF